MSRLPPNAGVRCMLALVTSVALAGCSGGHSSIGSSSSPSAATSAAADAGGSGSPGAASQSPQASGTPTMGTGSALTGLPYVPAGFTLPPGAVVESHDIVGTQTEVVLTAPSAAVAVPYLRQEITGLGYGQQGQRSSGGITAYAYRLGTSVLSVSGGSADGRDVTALVFQTG